MGLEISSEKPTESTKSIEQMTATGKIIKTAIGDFLELKSQESNEFFLKKTIIFEGTKNSESIKKGVKDLELANTMEPNLNLVWVYSAQFFENKLYCASSNASFVFHHFQSTLDDLISGNKIKQYFTSEADYWKLLFSIAKVIRFFNRNGFKGNFIHTKSLCFTSSNSEFSLMHPSFTNNSNLILAKAGSMHFCSPELFKSLQISNSNYDFDVGKSDLFSLGLIVIYLISLKSTKIDMDKLFNRLSGNFDGMYFEKVISEMKKTRVSSLLIRVLIDITNEFDHLRLSPGSFLDFFKGCEGVLITPAFNGHEAVLDNYLQLKGSRIIDNSIRHSMSSNNFGGQSNRSQEKIEKY